MQALVTTPDQPGRLVVRDQPAPSAAPGFALVRVRASSINRGETRLVPARPDGWAPGQDVAGIVETAAPDGGPPTGTRVVGLVDGGSWSELVAVPLDRLAVLPDAVSFEQAACLPVAGLTALRALRALGDVIGRSLLVTGATGGTGNLAAQLAVAAGARTTGLARRSFALPGVRAVTALNEDEQFERAIETAGGEALGTAIGHLVAHGKLVFFSGGAPVPFGLSSFKGSPATVEALFVYRAPGRFDDDLATLAAFVADGRLQPRIDRTVSAAEVNAGLDALNAGGIDGKIVITR